MSQNITLIRIFVSCPGDVDCEKKIVDDLCKQKNDQLTLQNCPLVFKVCEWKQIIGEHGPRPQEIINNRITYDIYMGIFWNRFGTPTGVINPETGEEFGSGTEEEYYKALGKWQTNKEAMLMYLFFKRTEGSKNSEEAAQILKVQQFREKTFPTGWVHDFSQTDEFSSKINAVLDGIMIKYLQSKNSKNFKLNGKTSLEYIEELKDLFEKTVAPLQYYIPRNVHKVNGERSIDGISLMDGFRTSNKMVVLANAGAGKSIALQQLGREVEASISPLFPIYQRFNTYVDQDLADFLPKQWKEVEPDNLLLLLDGIDEVSPDNFFTAIRKVQDFSDKNPHVKIIVSCRTNFYNLPTDTESGNLKGFDCYFLSDLGEEDIIKYVTSVFHMEGLQFIEEAYGHGFYEAIFNPFFLNLLLAYYKEHLNLESDRSVIIRHFIESRIHLDQQHFETTLKLDLSKKEILQTAGKVALAMELLGRNYVSEDELYEIIKLPEERKALKYFSAFNKSVQTTESWQFEHNNIREYLAAYLLADQPLDLLKSLASFAPDFNRIKPNWANTLSFLLNIGDKAETEQLINWLMERDPEMTVKTEKERIEPAMRLLIFKKIFDYYKEKQIWLQSNKFKARELATFGESEEAIHYLFNTFNDETLAKVVRLNALDLLEEMAMGKYPNYLPDLEGMLMSSLEKEQSDVGFVHSVLSAMAALGMNDKGILSTITGLFSNRSNQYIRAGLYKIIVNSEYLNDYVDLFLEGIFRTNEDEWKKDREGVNLADESVYLNRGLAKFNAPEAVKKLLVFFADALVNRRIHIYKKYQIISGIVINALGVYKKDKSVFDPVFALFITTGSSYDFDLCKSLGVFFRSTKTNVLAFEMIWGSAELKTYQKDFLLAALTDLAVLDHFANGIEDGTYSHKDAIWLHDALIRCENRGGAGGPVEKMEQLVEEKWRIHLEKPKLIDYTALQHVQRQKDLDLLFDKARFMSEITDFLHNSGLQTFTENIIRESSLYRVNEDDTIASAVYDFLQYLASDKEMALEDVVTFINNEVLFDDFRIQEIYELLRYDGELALSVEQKGFINKKCIALSKKINWARLAWVEENCSENTFSFDPNASIVWFFAWRVRVPLPQEMLLSFTLFEDFDSDLPVLSKSPIEFLGGIMDKKLLQNRITKNIKEGIDIAFIWRNNAKYAIAYDLKTAFPYILNDILIKSKINEYIRVEVLEGLLKNGVDSREILNLLTNTKSTVIQWCCVDWLMSENSHRIFLIGYLASILKAESVPNERGLKAASYLTELNSLDGLKYYLNYLRFGKVVPYDLDRARRSITKITIVEAVPLLMELLQIALQPQFLTERYTNRLDRLFLEALNQVAISSGEGLEEVRTSLTTFIKESRLPNLNYLYTSIARMEEAYYLSQSQSLSIKDVLRSLKSLE